MIPIKNIYYMLTYAFKILNSQGYRSIFTEKFHNTAELCAEILIKGLTIQLKRGIHCDYISNNESTSTIRGKIDVSESIKTNSMLRKQMICSYDEFSVNSYRNRIIKSTLVLLLKGQLSKERKKKIKNILLYFSEVETINLDSIQWNISYDRNNQSYRMLISICYLVINGLLQSDNDGNTKVMEFQDGQGMSRLYEKFILSYYRKEWKNITAKASQIKWQVDDGFFEMLPNMETDIMLSQGNNVLIIDAKFYSKTTQSRMNTSKIHSSNLYQIFTYVKNKDHELRDVPHKVSGMLLYAKTDELIVPNHEYLMSGNEISVKTLDLNCDFNEIKKQLDQIVIDYFSVG